MVMNWNTGTVIPQKCSRCGEDCGQVTYWLHQGIGNPAKSFCHECVESERRSQQEKGK